MSTILQDLARKAGEAGYCNIPALLEYLQAAVYADVVGRKDIGDYFQKRMDEASKCL